MAASRSANLELIRLQKLAKLRHEMELADLRAQSVSIELENAGLFEMQEKRFETGAAFVPVDIIMRRLETNKARQARLEEAAIAQRHKWLKVSRTIETLYRKLDELEAALARADAAKELEESMSHVLAKLPHRLKPPVSLDD